MKATEDDVLEALQERDEALSALHDAEGALRRSRELCAIRLQRIEELEKELTKARRYAQRLLDTHPDHMPSAPRHARPAHEDPDEHQLREER